MKSIRLLLILATVVLSTGAENFQGAELVCLEGSAQFHQERTADGLVLTARVTPRLSWNELIVSWNYRATNSGFRVETRVHYPGKSTKWYCLGLWAHESAGHPRESVRGQKDQDGEVRTDTLTTKRKGGEVELRITLNGEKPASDHLKLVTLSFCDTEETATPLPERRDVWGKALKVPERSQANYPEGISEWCSPTATSMVLSYWGEKLQRPDLDHDVPEVARGVHDPQWPGTGNWPFNTAYAGAHEGIRAYVTRLGGISEIESFVGAGFPVIASVSYNLLKGGAEPGGGHLVVVIGFGKDGEVIMNDPGRRQVHQVYPRANFVRAWAESRNTVYLVYPEKANVPAALSGHWCN